MLYFNEIMLMIVSRLTMFAKGEVLAFRTIVSDSYNWMHFTKKTSIFLMYEFVLQILHLIIFR